MNSESTPANVGSNDGLGLVPERATMRLTLADLGVLADTAERNGTAHAFLAVALQWAAGAQAEIERLRDDLKNFVNADIEWQDALTAAVAAERERCAKVCEDNAPDSPSYFEIAERLRECAAEIRRA